MLVGLILFWGFVALLVAARVRAESRRVLVVRGPRTALASRPGAIRDAHVGQAVRELEAQGFVRAGTWLLEPGPGGSPRPVYTLVEVLHDSTHTIEAAVFADRGGSAHPDAPVRVAVSSVDAAGAVVETGGTARGIREVHAARAEELEEVRLAPRDAGERLARMHERHLEALAVGGWLRATPAGFLPGWRRLARDVIHLLLLGDEAHPVVAKLLLGTIAMIGIAICGTFDGQYVWRPETGSYGLRQHVDPLIFLLFLVLGAAAFAVARRSALVAWGYACTPAGILLSVWVPNGAVGPWLVTGLAALAWTPWRASVDDGAEERRVREAELALLGLELTFPREEPKEPWRPAHPWPVHAAGLLSAIVIPATAIALMGGSTRTRSGPTTLVATVGDALRDPVALAGWVTVAVVALAALGRRRGVAPGAFACMVAALAVDYGLAVVSGIYRFGSSWDDTPLGIFGQALGIFTPWSFAFAAARASGFYVTLRAGARWWAGLALVVPPLVCHLVYASVTEDFHSSQHRLDTASVVGPLLAGLLLPLFVGAADRIVANLGVLVEEEAAPPP